MRLLIALTALFLSVAISWAKPDYPQTLVLIVCKVEFIGTPDDNAQMTGWRNTEWDTSGGVMHCARHEIELYDPDVDKGAQAQPFNPEACKRAAMMQGPQFDADHKDQPWRFWRAACPTPIWSDNGTPDDPRDDFIVGYAIPPCPNLNGTIVCELDSVI